MMDDLVEALKLLHYETRLCARVDGEGLPWITHDFFVYDFHRIKQAQTIAARQNKMGAPNGSRGAAIADADGQQSHIAVSLSANPPCAAPTPTQQLLYFGWIVLWLLSFLQRGAGRNGDPLQHEALSTLHDELCSWRPYAEYRDADEGESDERRASLATNILTHLAQARLPPCSTALTAALLSSTPSGVALLQPLYRLSQAVYFKKLHGSIILSPLALRHYPVFEPNPAYSGGGDDVDEDDDEVEEDVVEEEDGVAAMGDPSSEEAEAADDGYLPILAPTAAGSSVPGSALSDEALLAAQEAAAKEWMAEYNRLAESSALALNVARIPPAGQREWKQHQELVAKHAQALLQSPLLAAAPSSSSSSSITPSSLSNRAAELRRLLERISLFERRLHTEGTHASSQAAFSAARARLDELESAHAELSARNVDDTAALARAEEELLAKQEALHQRKDRLDDEGGLRALRRTLGTLRLEIRRFDVLLGIKRVLLQGHMTRMQAQRRTHK
jgi:hypothetical protein